MADDAASPAGQVITTADSLDDMVEAEDSTAVTSADEALTAPTKSPPRESRPVASVATLFGVVIVVALAALAGWLGFRAHESHQAQSYRSQFIQVARQGALNLTTIDWQQADANVQRILDGATGRFYDDFAKRSQPFIDVVKQAKSTTIGTVTEAGLESETPGTAQILVAVTVRTSNAGTPEQNPRSWRMRISVQQDGDETKVSNVEFVP